MAFPPVPFQEWFLRQTSTGNAALNAYVARVKADGGVVEAIGCVPQAVWDWVAPTLLLDLFPNAAAAYSLRKLRAAYSGAAVRVRRSSDNTEQDIGFTTQGELDTASLLSFVNEDVVVYTSDFTSGNEDLNETNGTGSDGETIDGVSNAYKFTLSGGSGLHQAIKGLGLSGGGTATISFDYYIPSTNTAVDGLLFGLISGTTQSETTTDAWTSVSLSVTNFGNGNAFFRAIDGGSATIDADGDVFYLKNIVVTQTTADGLVSAWYDQSLSNDATQSTAANQPKIVSAGSLIELNSKAAINGDSADDFLSLSTGVDLSSGYSIFKVAQVPSANTYGITLSNSAGNDRNLIFNEIFRFQLDGTNNNNFGASGNLGAQYLWSLVNDSSGNLNTNRNGSAYGSQLTGLTGTFTFKNIGTNIGVNSFEYFQELIVFNSDQSSNRTGIEANINNFYSIYP